MAQRRAAPERPKRFETARALLVAVGLALLIRSFVFEPFTIPSGSMIPTLLVGDYLVVNKFKYGLRLPHWGTLLVPMGEPHRGDIVVFRFPDNESKDFIKRIVGLPGDRVEVRGDQLFVNEKPFERAEDGTYRYFDFPTQREKTTRRYRETNPEGVTYNIIHERQPLTGRHLGPWAVPEGHYFMMGDNRDNSGDSRMWRNPYVSESQIKGKATRIHWSWIVTTKPVERGFVRDLLYTLWRVVTFQIEQVRWDRIGRSVDGRAAD